MPDRKRPKLVLVDDSVARAKLFRRLAIEARRQAGLANSDAISAAYMRLAIAYDDFAAALEDHKPRYHQR